MAIDTYAALKSAVASWLHRADLTSNIPDFIALAEERIARDLAGVEALLATSSPIALVAGDTSFNLPAGALGLHSATITTDYITVLNVIGAQQFAELATTTTGRPRTCAMRGNAGAGGAISVLVWPTADAAYSVSAVYPTTLTALSDSNTTGWLLTKAPSLYLFGALCEAAPFLSNDARIAVWEGKYRQAVEGVRGMPWAGPQTLGTELPTRYRSDIFNG